MTMEIWGGVECTLNRVGDSFHSQMDKNGHWDRLTDIDAFRELGLRTLRFPVLWEQHAPTLSSTPDWSSIELRLSRLRDYGVRPIIGFVHHGSGPHHTDLLDPGFPAKLCSFASEFAKRFPWVDAYTPINEPLTTARFSGLYGVWYPHHRSDRSFLQMLWNECRAIRDVMKIVRRHNPKAELIQTEDLGKVESSGELRYQAEFENHRRFLSFDLLSGVFDHTHPLYGYVLGNGISEAEILDLKIDPCPPDVLGINHYITSNRYLDSRLDLYPSSRHGGNGRHTYVDVEAIRIREARPHRPSELFLEAWERYRIPIALTEVHLGCTEDEQIRWLKHMYDAAQEALREGADIRAFTVWSLLGSYDWDSLVTASRGHYEAGVFDLSQGDLRPTLLTEMLSCLIKGEKYQNVLLERQGWWTRSDRFLHKPLEKYYANDRNCGKWFCGRGFGQRARRLEAV